MDKIDWEGVGVPYKRWGMSEGDDSGNVPGHGHFNKNLVLC